MKEARISVAMATYNGERFLQEQLDSLARQTLLPCELVACDDGSTDGTLDILHRFAAEAPFPVLIYRNEIRLGHGGNFLRAASLCSGSLIAFSDQDDVWLAHKLQRCADVISETRSVLAIHSGRVVDENLRPLGGRTPSASRQLCLDAASGRGWHSLGSRLAMSPGFACVFQSTLLTRLPPDRALMGPRTGHEHWLFFAAEAVGSVVLIPDPLVLYRQHGRNTAGFQPQPYRPTTFGTAVRVSGSEYADQAKDAATRAKLLADASERPAELRARLARAQHWYEARADSLNRRALLYSPPASFLTGVGRLLTMIVNRTYRGIPRGGLGLKGLAKDLLVPFLPRAVRKMLGNAQELPAEGMASHG